MNQNMCYNCGGEIVSRGGRLICSSCGSYMPEQISGEEVSLLYAAFQKLRLADFYEAEREFDDIIRRHPRNAQGYWGRLMSHYGIKYEKDYDGRCIPTCYATSIDSVYESSDYRKAMTLADAETQAVFKDHADYMERVRKEWLEKASREKPYDIFISFKDSDTEEQKNGREHTVDSDYLRELYFYLLKKGYRVFFSRESLEGKGGEKYEPYIYAALSTAKVMLVYGSKPEYINATWVKNEWTRYQKRIRSGEKHPDSLIVAYKGFSPKDLPFELSESGRQHLDASKDSFYNEFLEIVDRIMSEVASKNGVPTAATEPKKKKPVISALHEHSYKEIVVKPTCISMGYTLHQCECGEEYKDSFTPLGDHSYQVTNRIDPTCTENGSEEETCGFCGQKQTRELPAIGHAFTEWTEAKRPTCTEDGEEQRQCQNCGEIETKALQKTGHSFGDWMKNPDGTSVRYCKHCGTTKTKAAKAAKEAKAAKTERVQETVQEETITETKKKKRVLPVLLSLFSLIIVGCIAGFIYFGSPANHNNDENSSSSAESNEKPSDSTDDNKKPSDPAAKPSEGLAFELNADGTYSVSGIGTCTDTEIVIPTTYNGKAVTSIASNAFFYCKSLTSIIIPDGVDSIGDSVFYYCSSLTSVTIPDSVTRIGRSAFYGCSKLTSITIPNSVTSIGRSAFYGCNRLTSIAIPDSVTSIESAAFSGCTSLTGITIPNSVTSIGGAAFSGCIGLTSITIPNSVTSIGGAAFEGCTSLTSIALPFVGNGKNSTHFGHIFGASSSSDNGKNVPSSLKTVVITGGSSIGGSAFSGCTGLTSITIPDSVTSIVGAAFYGCSNLTSVIIPDSVTSIGISAFSGCTALTKIQFKGTKAKWEAIRFSSGWNDNTGNYTVTCTNGNIYKN